MAGAPLVFPPAWQALTQWSDPPRPRAKVRAAGDRASGGVGTASVLLGRAMNLTVVALSRSAEKGGSLKELGADFVFNPQDQDLRKAILAATAPKRVDLAVDTVGGPLFNEVIAMLGRGGRISVVGQERRSGPGVHRPDALFCRNRIGGVEVGDYTPEAAQATWDQIVGHLNADGKAAGRGWSLPVRGGERRVRASVARTDGKGVGARRRLLRIREQTSRAAPSTLSLLAKEGHEGSGTTPGPLDTGGDSGLPAMGGAVGRGSGYQLTTRAGRRGRGVAGPGREVPPRPIVAPPESLAHKGACHGPTVHLSPERASSTAAHPPRPVVLSPSSLAEPPRRRWHEALHVITEADRSVTTVLLPDEY